MKKFLLLFALCGIAFAACKNTGKINAGEAGEVISDYLDAYPEYETGRFNFGEIKFNSKSEMLELEKYKTLANEGYIDLEQQEGHKKFLSKDSSFVYIVKLADKAADLVLKQSDDKATVKVATYELANEKPVNFNQVNEHQAKVTVTLKKTNTVFAPFQKSGNAHSDFITRTYRLKLDKEAGWQVVK